MASIKRKSVTRPLPSGAKIEQRQRIATRPELVRAISDVQLAERIKAGRIVDDVVYLSRPNGKPVACPVVTRQDGSLRIRCFSETYFAKYRDAEGQLIERPTGCRDKENARAKLSEFVAEVERIRVKILSKEELNTSKASLLPIDEHVRNYEKHLRDQPGKGKRARVSPVHVGNSIACIRRMINDCGFRSLASIKREIVESWVTERLNERAVGNPKAMANAAIDESLLRVVRSQTAFDQCLGRPPRSR